MDKRTTFIPKFSLMVIDAKKRSDPRFELLSKGRVCDYIMSEYVKITGLKLEEDKTRDVYRTIRKS